MELRVDNITVSLDDGCIRNALLNDAEKIATKISRTATNKLRQYYKVICDVLTELEHLAQEDRRNESGIWVKFYLLKAKAKYDKTRQIISQEFYLLISEIVNKVGNDIDKLKKVKLFMEAVVGFFPKK